jgi:DNA-binding transcriptional ArsR family regulator
MSHISYKQFFATLSGDSRLDILHYLQESGAQNVSAIATATGQEQSAVSHNLKKLLACNCVHIEVRGKNRVYSLNQDTIVPLLKLADNHIQNYCQADCEHCGKKADHHKDPGLR